MLKIKKIFCLLLFIVFSASCDRSTIDSDTGMSRKNVKDVLNMGEKDSNTTMVAPNKNTPPSISKLLVAPPPPPMGNGELISFAFT